MESKPVDGIYDVIRFFETLLVLVNCGVLVTLLDCLSMALERILHRLNLFAWIEKLDRNPPLDARHGISIACGHTPKIPRHEFQRTLSLLIRLPISFFH